MDMDEPTQDPRTRRRRPWVLALASVLAAALLGGFLAWSSSNDDQDPIGQGGEAAGVDEPGGEDAAGDGDEDPDERRASAKEDLTALTEDSAADLIGAGIPAGSYLYDQHVEQDGEQRDGETPVEVGEYDQGSQLLTYGTGQRDRYRWGDGGVVVDETLFGEMSCRWDTPIERYAFPLDVGASWEVNSRCEASSPEGGQTAQVELAESATVLALRTRTVGDRTFDVVVIERTINLRMTTAFEDLAEPVVFESDDKVTEEYAPAVGLWVHRRIEYQRNTQSGPVRGVGTTTLRRFTPA